MSDFCFEARRCRCVTKNALPCIVITIFFFTLGTNLDFGTSSSKLTASLQLDYKAWRASRLWLRMLLCKGASFLALCTCIRITWGRKLVRFSVSQGLTSSIERCSAGRAAPAHDGIYEVQTARSQPSHVDSKQEDCAMAERPRRNANGTTRGSLRLANAVKFSNMK